VKVLDFGIAKAEERATKTVGGTIKGKYGYMSPEQCKGKPIDRRSDIFALGIVLYELTTLRRAFKGNDDFETMKRIVAGDLVLPSTVIQGYPRELEAIILTALASDPNARFQTAQELIEALDAFTVRAKLTGSNTVMGRFMLQLFGTKKEPWIDVGAETDDHTLVTPAELEDYEDDNDETLVVSNRPDVQRALDYLNIAPPTRAPAATSSHSRVVPAGSSEIPKGMLPAEALPRGALPRPALPAGVLPAVVAPGIVPAPLAPSPLAPGPLASGPHTASNPALAPTLVPVTPSSAVPDADGSRPPEVKRSSTRRSSERPSLPFATPSAAAPAEPGRTSSPHLAATIVGSTPIAPIAPTPAHNSGLPQLVQSEDISEVGSVPLVNDPKLGWETAVKLVAANDGSHTRIESEPVDYRIRSNAMWFVVAIMIALAILAVIIAILES
jgi:serine/threonine protein kinase